jgi:hypothetical protein
MDQRSSRLLDETSTLDLTDVEDPTDQLILMMDAMVEWQRVEALGWWEHTADWDLEIVVLCRDGARYDLVGSPGFHLEIGGQTYMPWDLLMKATEIPINFLDTTQVPPIVVHITDAWEFGDDDIEGHEISMTFDLSTIATVIHNR